LLVTANVVTISKFLVTLMMEVARSSETTFIKIDTRCNIPDDGTLRYHLQTGGGDIILSVAAYLLELLENSIS
jgi:hypothetical protein